MVSLIVQLFFYMILAFFAVRFASSRLKRMQRKRKPNRFDDRYSKHWQRKH